MYELDSNVIYNMYVCKNWMKTQQDQQFGVPQLKLVIIKM